MMRCAVRAALSGAIERLDDLDRVFSPAGRVRGHRSAMSLPAGTVSRCAHHWFAGAFSLWLPSASHAHFGIPATENRGIKKERFFDVSRRERILLDCNLKSLKRGAFGAEHVYPKHVAKKNEESGLEPKIVRVI
jgi:hypothetical protein